MMAKIGNLTIVSSRHNEKILLVQTRSASGGSKTRANKHFVLLNRVTIHPASKAHIKTLDSFF
jgi:hypothetical protein